jgi:hypothetical protein
LFVCLLSSLHFGEVFEHCRFAQPRVRKTHTGSAAELSSAGGRIGNEATRVYLGWRSGAAKL